jgi:hypothetical protein
MSLDWLANCLFMQTDFGQPIDLNLESPFGRRTQQRRNLGLPGNRRHFNRIAQNRKFGSVMLAVGVAGVSRRRDPHAAHCVWTWKQPGCAHDPETLTDERATASAEDLSRPRPDRAGASRLPAPKRAPFCEIRFRISRGALVCPRPGSEASEWTKSEDRGPGRLGGNLLDLHDREVSPWVRQCIE